MRRNKRGDGMRFLDALKFWDKKEQITGFAAVDTLGKAQLMMSKGMVERIYVKPVRFGGAETPENRVYVPIGIGRVKDQHDDKIEVLLNDTPDLQYACLPKYRGMSRIPYELAISATTNDEEKKVLYSETISIW